jgi:hypothetical protein
MEYPQQKIVQSSNPGMGEIVATPLFYFDALDTSIPHADFLNANTQFRKLLGFFSTHALEHHPDTEAYPHHYVTKFVVYAAEKRLNPKYPLAIDFESKKVQDFLAKYPFVKLPGVL